MMEPRGEGSVEKSSNRRLMIAHARPLIDNVERNFCKYVELHLLPRIVFQILYTRRRSALVLMAFVLHGITLPVASGNCSRDLLVSTNHRCRRVAFKYA